MRSIKRNLEQQISRIEEEVFWDQYESSVHSKNISEVDKSVLTGASKDCISGLTQTKENYEHAINLFSERLGDINVLIRAHMESIVALPQLKSINQLTESKKLYDQIETTVRNLRSLKVDTGSWGSLLVPVLLDKLPNGLKTITSRRFGNNIWTIDELLGYFKEELQAKIEQEWR